MLDNPVLEGEVPDNDVPPNWVVISAAVTPAMAKSIRKLAAESERSLSGEIRFALAVHLGWLHKKDEQPQ